MSIFRLKSADVPEFEPSPALRYAVKRARTLNRNVQRASIFNPRLHRRALAAGIGARSLDAHERRAFEEANA